MLRFARSAMPPLALLSGLWPRCELLARCEVPAPPRCEVPCELPLKPLAPKKGSTAVPEGALAKLLLLVLAWRSIGVWLRLMLLLLLLLR